MLPDLIPNTHRALALGELARDGGEARHEAVHRAIFDTYYGRGLDIGNTDVLLEVARAQGFDAEEVASVWDAGTFDERLEQFRHLALHIGIGSTPTALICNELLIGSRPYEVLKAAVDRCLVTPESVAAEISEGSHSELVGSEGSTPADADA